ncbi:hypothetical protein [Rhodopirellula bahusiensis]|uniref:Uncharacterized protein n=1 Tax=Rhodopirellula bahusiensis TaxID=2014065 RepID=A0A2G1W750_9BACT|nr:hypothetical protein [Rhodopirellula bahusiensis]PHQ34836.1 hypothetical protein CEE69_13295 [Rhodopirellula bahusiensis]
MGHSKLELVLGSKQVLARSKLELGQVRSKVLELGQVRSKRLVLELARSKLELGLVRSKLVLVLRSKLELVRSSFSF